MLPFGLGAIEGFGFADGAQIGLVLFKGCGPAAAGRQNAGLCLFSGALLAALTLKLCLFAKFQFSLAFLKGLARFSDDSTSI